MELILLGKDGAWEVSFLCCRLRDACHVKQWFLGRKL
jgi:hypothetical protein